MICHSSTNMTIFSGLVLMFGLGLVALGEDRESKEEIAFPQMFKPDSYGQLQIHIVSEIIDEGSGYQTLEEYLDLELGLMALIKSNIYGQTTLLIDARNDFAHKYQPYTCESTNMNAVNLESLDGWKTEAKFRDKSTNQEHDLNLYGVSGLWTFASDRPKTYVHQETIYNAASDAFRLSHNWTVIDDDGKLRISLNFVDQKKKNSNEPDLVLSLIQIRSLVTGKLMRTINILELEYLISDEARDDLLQVPVGYGCLAPTNEKDQFDPLNDDEEDMDAQKLDIEVTATIFESSDKTNANIPSQVKRNSDIVSVDLAYGKTNRDSSEVQMIRYRDSKMDTKHVINHALNTNYIIDLRRGTCEIKHLSLKKTEREATVLKFANGLSLTLDVTMMNDLFIKKTDFNFIKKLEKTNSNSRSFYESNLIKINGNEARVIRLYSASHSLESVTIWIFDSSKTKLSEIYHINIIQIRKIVDTSDAARIFDVSEECYLNNDKMHAGKDYAWLEFTYPVFGRYINQLANREQQMREIFYENWVENFYRIPRIEFLFDESSFKLRLLEIDLPPVTIIFEPLTGKKIDINKEAGDIDELAPDLHHCADWCRLHQCQAMTFCDSGQCILSTKSISSEVRGSRLIVDNRCNSYTIPEDRPDLERLLLGTMHREISQLEQIDYSAVVLPQPPDELIYPRSETGIDKETYDKISKEYEIQLKEAEEKNANQLPNLVFRLDLNGHMLILLPSKFELEHDPLGESDLLDFEDSSETESGNSIAFHQGLSQARFKYDSFHVHKDKSARIFTGFNYDQCQIACINSKCSSFSYCNHRQECITTSINGVVEAKNSGLIEQDLDCFIEQRDFLTNFHKFSNIYRPNSYLAMVKSYSPSECAFNCISQTECLAFDYCITLPSKVDQPGECFFLEQRHISNEVAFEANTNINETSKLEWTGCDHFSRSYLADFVRLESREIKPDELIKLKSTTLEGHSVFKCADICVNELIDCTAFQFCLDPSAKGPMQSCTMVQSKPQGESVDPEAKLDANEKIISAGNFFDTSLNCHVFAMKSYTSAAHLRDLAIGVRVEGDSNFGEPQGFNGRGMSLGGGILLYLCTAFVFAAIGASICIVKENSNFVRDKVFQIRTFLRL